MNISFILDRLKNEHFKLQKVLEEIGMHTVQSHTNYFSCAFPDGDNIKACIVYKDSLNVEAYTRDIKDKNGYSNIISLIMFVKQVYFLKALKLLCAICEYDYYNRDYEPPKLLMFLNELRSLQGAINNHEVEEIVPINERILESYIRLPNKKFLKDGIKLSVQNIFEVGYDLESHRITIPIRDEVGNLIGVKGRIYDDDLSDSKYMYIEPCAKSKVLFGLDKTYEHIKEAKIVYVAESEKAVMQAWSNGVKNVVSIGGHQLSKDQVRKLIHLGVEICLCYDDRADYIPKTIDGKVIKDKSGDVIYEVDNNFYNKEKCKFIDGMNISYIYDFDNSIIKHKNSPFDHMDQWGSLIKMKGQIYEV